LEEMLNTKTHKLDKSVLSVQTLADEAAAGTDRKFKELTSKLDATVEESESAQKKLEKKLRAHIEDFDRLQSEVSRGAGGSANAGGSALDEALRQKVASLSTVNDRVEALQSSVQSIQTRMQDFVLQESFARDLKALQTTVHSSDDNRAVDSRQIREQLQAAIDRQDSGQRTTLERLAKLDEKVQKVPSDEKRIVDASTVEKQVDAVRSQVDALERKVKESSSVHVESIKRVESDLKLVKPRMEAIEATNTKLMALVQSSGVAQSSVPSPAIKDLSSRVGKLELNTVPALATQVETLSSQMAARESALARINSDMQALSAAAAESEEKHAKHARELKEALDTQLAAEQDMAVHLKATTAAASQESAAQLALAEQRMHDELSLVQTSLSQHDAALLQLEKDVGVRLEAMEASLEEALESGLVGGTNGKPPGAKAPATRSGVASPAIKATTPAKAAVATPPAQKPPQRQPSNAAPRKTGAINE
jgi:chromosome segregation ATPase